MKRLVLRLAGCLGLAALALAAVPLPASAQEGACLPATSIRYLDVDVAVEPPSGAAGSAVTLSARCLPADSPVIVWSGQAFDAVRPVGSGSIDALGSFAGEATVPADAVPGEDFYFAIMIEDRIVGTGSFRVDGDKEEDATTE